MLVVNDETEIGDLIQIMLGRGRNDEVRYAYGGCKGLAAAERYPPELILLDIMMPEMDGWEVCSKLRAIPALQNVPLLFFAALAPKWACTNVQRVGGQGYLSLPFGPRELLAARDALLTGKTYFP